MKRPSRDTAVTAPVAATSTSPQASMAAMESPGLKRKSPSATFRRPPEEPGVSESVAPRARPSRRADLWERPETDRGAASRAPPSDAAPDATVPSPWAKMAHMTSIGVTRASR